MLVYLICVCGKSHDGEFRTTWVDNIWAEVHLAAMAIFGVYGVVLCVLIIDEYIWDNNIPINLILVAVGAIAGLASAVVLTSLLSIIRNIKCRRLIDTSLVLRVIRWIFRGFAAFWRIIWRALSRKTGFILIAMLLVYTAIIGLFGVFLPHSPVWLVLGILVFLFACFIIGYRVRDLEEIKRGVRAAGVSEKEAVNAVGSIGKHLSHRQQRGIGAGIVMGDGQAALRFFAAGGLGDHGKGAHTGYLSFPFLQR